MNITGQHLEHDDDFLVDADDADLRPARTRKLAQRLIFVIAFVIAVAPVFWLIRGQGLVTRAVRTIYPDFRVHIYAPKVLTTIPESGAFNVRADAPLSVEMRLSNCQVDSASITPDSVFLVSTGDQQAVAAKVKFESGQLAITPASALSPLTSYTLHITSALKDTRGQATVPFVTSFTTGGKADADIRFEKVLLPITKGNGVTCLAIGPDGKLWAGTDDGRVLRYPIRDDGTLGEPDIIKSLQDANHGPRILLGFDFDKSATAENPTIWVTHSYHSFVNTPDFTGKVTRMSGPKLQKVEDVVINLPRSIKDHQTMQPKFGPDGALYFCQASNTAMGAPDSDWGMRDEHLLNATILRLDTTRVKPNKPIDARTRDCGGTFDPAAPDSPLTIYATGVRLSYDLCWHSNGHLYAPTNGSSDGGNTPAEPKQSGVPGLKDVPFAEDDWLHRIEPGGYYGHPNPVQGHYVMNGGNPSGKWSFGVVPQYPVGTQPDPQWQPAAWDMGPHISANGCVEYIGDACNGKLNHKLLICRYNWGSDIAVVGFDQAGNVISHQTGFIGLKNFQSPLDITEDLKTGNLYLSEYAAQQVTLLKPVEPGAALQVAPEVTRTRSTKLGSGSDAK